MRYDGPAMLGALIAEAHRAGAVVIGEDLGTVLPEVRQAMSERQVLGSAVLWFTRRWEEPGQPLAKWVRRKVTRGGGSRPPDVGGRADEWER